MKVDVIKTSVSAKMRNNGRIDFPLAITLGVKAPMSWWHSFLDSGLGEVVSQENLYQRFIEWEFELGDFECDELSNYGPYYDLPHVSNDTARYAHARVMELIIASLNGARDRYLDYEAQYQKVLRYEPEMKNALAQIMILLPQSYLIRGEVVIHICDGDVFRLTSLADTSPHWKKVYDAIDEFLGSERSKNEH